MKTFRHILLLLQTALLFGLFTASCHDDLDTGLGSTYEPTIGTGIVLKIPNLKAAATRAAATRADGVANTFGDEGTVQTMHLFVFPVDGNGKKVYLDLTDEKFKDTYAQLPCLDPNDPTKEIYAGATLTEGTDNMTTVEVPMYPGKYKIYLLANLDNYAVNASGSTITIDEDLEESAITNMHLKFDKGPVSPDELPMYCSPSDLKYTTSSGTTTAVSDGVFDILTNDVKSLQADLKFQVAKVRYTVLFNSTKGATEAENGFSYPQFKEDYKLSIESAEVDHVVETTKLTGGDDPDDYTFAGAGKPYTFQFDGNADSNGDKHAGHFKVKYPTDVSGFTEDYPFCNNNSFGGNGNANTTERLSNLPHISAETEWSNQSKRAWQGIVYLPENLNDATDSDNNPVGRTVLALKATVNGNGVSNGDNTYKVPLISGTVDGSTDSKIERGNFYDIRALAKGLHDTEINFSVVRWEAIDLFYELQGPVYLNVEKTNISVESGIETRFGYESNVPVSFYSPTWKDAKGNDIEFYDIWTEDGRVVVTVNSEIPATDLVTIGNDATLKKQYMYFHIKAGNIHKKITVDPLNLEPFLMVDPEEVTINVREQIASNFYEGKFKITVKTNCPTYTVIGESWSKLVGTGNSGNTSTLLYVTDEAGNKIAFGAPRTPVKGEEVLYLCYAGLNDGEPFWTKDPQEMGLTFKASIATVEDDHIYIKTRPSNDKYIIHLKVSDDWKNPHMYAYQCLEFPGWYHVNSGEESVDWKYANQAVGYKVWNDKKYSETEGGYDYFAALEYSFTGKVSFYGWDNTNNSALLPSTTGWDKEGGFYIIDVLNLDKSAVASYYDMTYDFFADYRKGKDDNGNWLCPCSGCRDGGFKLWPGIAMTKENNDGWWKVELTGAATPGRTLLMFASVKDDSHEGTTPRYPQHEKVGVPLFDYESREGWIDMSDGKTASSTNYSFTSVNPNAATDGMQTFRITWYCEYKLNGNNIPYDKIKFTAGPKTGTYSAMGHGDDGNQYYYEFKMDPSSPQNVSWEFVKNDGTNPNNNKFNTTGMGDWVWEPNTRQYRYKVNIIGR